MKNFDESLNSCMHDFEQFCDSLNWFDVTYYDRTGDEVTHSYFVPPVDFGATYCSLFDAWYIFSKVFGKSLISAKRVKSVEAGVGAS